MLTRDLEVGYTALGFTAPEGLRFLRPAERERYLPICSVSSPQRVAVHSLVRTRNRTIISHEDGAWGA